VELYPHFLICLRGRDRDFSYTCTRKGSQISCGDVSKTERMINIVLYFRSCTLNVWNYQAEVLHLEYMYVPFDMKKKIRTVISAQKISQKGVYKD